jgi:hypothetical protein
MSNNHVQFNYLYIIVIDSGVVVVAVGLFKFFFSPNGNLSSLSVKMHRIHTLYIPLSYQKLGAQASLG